MEKGKFSYLLLEHQRQEDFDFFEKNYIPDHDFIHQSYEKFKPKKNANQNLVKTENKVKKLLSNFLKKMESNKNYDDITNSDIEEEKPIQKNKKLEKLDSNGNLRDLKSFRVNKKLSEKFISFNINSNSEIKNKLNINNKNAKRKNISNNNIKQKFGERVNKIDIENNNNFSPILISNKRLKNYKNKNVGTFKEKINNILQRTKTYGLKLMKKSRNRFGSIDYSKHNNNNNKTIHSNKIKNNNSLIKRQKSFNYDNTYLNFKNSNILLNKNINESFIIDSSLLKKKKLFSKIVKARKNDIFNESKNNSILSDLSDIHLNRVSFDNKKEQSYMRESRGKMKTTIHQLSPNKNKDNSISNLKITNGPGYLSNISKNNDINNSFNIKQAKDFLKVMNIQKDSIDDFKRAETTNRTPLFQKKKFYASQNLKFNLQLKSLKNKLKNSLTLHEDDFKSNKKNKIKNKNNNLNKFKTLKLEERKNSLNNIKSYENSLKQNMNNNINDNCKTLFNENNDNQNILENNLEKNIGLELLNNENNLEKNEYTLGKEKTNSITINQINANIFKLKNKTSINSLKSEINRLEIFRNLEHKPLVYDSLDDEELEDQEEIYRLYIDPDSLFSITFDSILLIINLLSFIVNPLYLAMTQNFYKENKINFISLLNYFIEFMNIADLFLGFFRAYYNWEEQLIVKSRFLITHYLSSWFVFDLISSFPVYLINQISENKYNQNKFPSKHYEVILNNIYYIFIINRLFKIFKIFLNNQAWKIFSNKLNENWNIIFFIFITLSSINYTACMYIFIGRNSYPNWILRLKIKRSFISIYICAIYTIMMAITTVGYGDITCYSLKERIFQLLLLNIGIIAYSWVISYLSNYIKKINKKSVDFEKKLRILKEIRINNPNLPNNLYNRIFRHLNFKNIYDKNLKKNIIFDCLPSNLKNDLISEMYKPIISNFMFFKNFQNKDFIVRIILAFKPIIAYKNDILINEGDMVEDILFVKKGVLALELPINMENPQENIEKYLNSSNVVIEKEPNLQFKGTFSFKQRENSNKKNYLFDSSPFLNKGSTLKYIASFNKGTTLKTINSLNKQKEEKEKITQNITYVKIVWIRQNEHFGDVLMFLEQRSPLRVRVRSKKSELFFLKKLDAIQISTSYPNLWKRINKKSIFNFEQMKKSIKKIVEIYSSVKKSTNKKKAKEDNSNKHEMKNKEYLNSSNNSYKKSRETLIKIRKNSLDMKKNDYMKFFKKSIKDGTIINSTDKCVKKNLSMKNLKTQFNINNNSKIDLLSDPSDSSSKTSILSGSSFYSPINIKKNEKIEKNKNDNLEKIHSNKKVINESFEYNKLNDEKYLTYKEKLKEKSLLSNSFKEKKTISSNKIKKISLNNSCNKSNSLNKSLSENNIFILKNNKENELNSSYSKEINEEFEPGECLQINNEEHLLNKKLNLDFISTKPGISEKNNNIIYNNYKIKVLIESVKDENDNMTIKDNYKNNYNDNNFINEKSNKNLNLLKNNYNIFLNTNDNVNYRNIVNDNENNIKNNKISESSNNNQKYENRIINWTNNLIFNNNISFQITSSYENFNLISNYKFIKNYFLQNKIKEYLLEEINNLSNNNNIADTIKKDNNNENKNNINNISEIKNIINIYSVSTKRFKKNINANNNNQNKIEGMPKLLKTHSSDKNLENKFTNIIEKNPKITLNNKFKSTLVPQINFDDTLAQKTVFQENLNSIININSPRKIRKNRRSSFLPIMKTKKIQGTTLIQSTDVKKKRRASLIQAIPSIEAKKKKANILSRINFNIEKTNQNLNNPDEFYSSYFSSILLNEYNQKSINKNLYTKNLSNFIFDKNKKENKIKNKK